VGSGKEQASAPRPEVHEGMENVASRDDEREDHNDGTCFSPKFSEEGEQVCNVSSSSHETRPPHDDQAIQTTRESADDQGVAEGVGLVETNWFALHERLIHKRNRGDSGDE
jgi:hypothetical protein